MTPELHQVPAGPELGASSGSPGESQMDDLNVICPYCLYSYQAESEDFDEQERKQICGGCDREFLLYDGFTVTHYTRPMPSGNMERSNEGGKNL